MLHLGLSLLEVALLRGQVKEFHPLKYFVLSTVLGSLG